MRNACPHSADFCGLDPWPCRAFHVLTCLVTFHSARILDRYPHISYSSTRISNMGWLRLNVLPSPAKSAAPTPKAVDSAEQDTLVNGATSPLDYPRQPEDTATESLPMIRAEVVASTQRKGDLVWIVVNEIVYDCTDFVHEHPGGNTVIESFRGQDCTWQFWRFHNQKHLREFGHRLRVGRTSGVRNRFPEPVKFVGLRRPGLADEW